MKGILEVCSLLLVFKEVIGAFTDDIQVSREVILHSDSYAAGYEEYMKVFYDRNQRRGLLGSSYDAPLSPREGLKEKTREKHRQHNFLKSLKQAKKHNRNFKEGISSYTQTVNVFSIMDADEKSQYEGLWMHNASLYDDSGNEPSSSPLLAKSLPVTLDWTELGFVTSVKNQDKCGACWAFAAVVPLEFWYKKHSGYLVSLSEQELLDCTYEQPETFGLQPGHNGCSGGLITHAWEYLVGAETLPSRRDVPYTNRDGSCRATKHKDVLGGVMKVGRHKKVQKGSVESMMQVLSSSGPVAVGIHVGNDLFNYDKGIYSGCKGKGFYRPNHAAAVVGYGEHFWNVKNSWGSEWGDGGYVKITRANTCGVLDMASYIVATAIEGAGKRTKKNNIIQDETPSAACKDAKKEDNQYHCVYWKMKGYCQSHLKFMTQYCAQTCGIC